MNHSRTGGSFLLLVLLLTLLCGGGYVVLRRPVRAFQRQDVLVDPTRIALARAPDWLDGPIGRSLLREMIAHTDGPVPLLDEAGAQVLARAFGQSPWVEHVTLGRVFPDRFRVELQLRRPQAWVTTLRGGRVLLDGAGRALPPPDVAPAKAAEWFDALPQIVGQRLAGEPVPGKVVADRAILAGARVAAEYRAEFAPRLTFDLPLAQVDVTNFEYRYLRNPERAEVRVVVRCADGGTALLEWGHAPGSERWRVISPVVKAQVAQQIAARHPGLAGVGSADLRVQHLWEHWLRLRGDVTVAGGTVGDRAGLDAGDPR